MEERFILKELCRYHIGTYADIIYRNAILYADDEAFVYGPERLTFAQYNERVNSLIHALNSMKVKKGDVIGILSWNCLDYADFFGAAMKGGFVASPFNPRLQADELDYLINYSRANTLFVGPEFLETIDTLRPRLPNIKNYISVEGKAEGMLAHSDLLETHSKEEPDVWVAEDDPLIIFYTSGTTGVPRGALYTHRRKMEDTRLFAFGLTVEPGDKEIMAIPLFHVAGASYLFAFFYGGGVNIIFPQRAFDPAGTLKMIQDEKVTDIHIVPTNLVSMLSLPDIQKYDLSSLKRIWYAGSPMPVEVLKKGMDIFGPVFIQAYGQSESGPFVSKLSKRSHQVLDKPPEEQKILASCGQPCPGVHVRIVDGENQDARLGEVGEIVIKSRSLMKEYWQKPDETGNTLIDGWLHTGDMGYYDKTGNIYLVDRKKDMIISGGENVYPREVEEILYRHPAIEEVAVIGLPDPYWVESVHAVIVLKKGASAEQGEIIAFCKEHLARYKAPKSVDFVESLPKNPQGKILKREIREAYS
ncbi:long-chain-fatty-acid--CoA ligase [bacterium]|nr:long-chain-fatty-acid--CoA ligase [bacterium]